MTKFTVDERKAHGEPTIRLWAMQDQDGVFVSGQDEAGRIRVLLRSKPDGTFERYPAAQLRGLQTDDNGRVVIVDA